MAVYTDAEKRLRIHPGINQSQDLVQNSPGMKHTQSSHINQNTPNRAMRLHEDGELQFYFITAVLFQLFFLLTVTGFYRVIIIPNYFFRDVTREYLVWYMEKRAVLSYEQTALELAWIIKLLCTPIFLLGILRLLLQKEYARSIGRKPALLTLALGAAAYALFLYYNKYQAEHYRLYMTLISTELLSLILLNLFRKLRSTRPSSKKTMRKS